MRQLRVLVLSAGVSCLGSVACGAAPNARQAIVPFAVTAGAVSPNDATGACRPSEFDAGTVERETGPATLQIAAGQSLGSGFVIDDAQGPLVVTNFHVVSGGATQFARVTLKDGSEREAPLEVVIASRDADLALLRPTASIGARPLTLASELPSVGDSVAAVGYPGVAGSTFVRTFEPGTITAAQRHLGSIDFIQTNANINPGNSGGPLVDRCGRVIGVVTARHSTTERLGLVIPSRAVNQLLAEYHKPQLAPEKAAEAELQHLLTEVKFRRSDKAALYFTRDFIEKAANADWTSVTQSGRAKLTALLADLRRRNLSPAKLGEPGMSKELSAHLTPAELQALVLQDAVAQNKLSAFDAASQFFAGRAGDLFGNLEDVWLENTAVTPQGCVDAYVTAMGDGQTRRYLVHLHHELGQWLIHSIKRMR